MFHNEAVNIEASWRRVYILLYVKATNDALHNTEVKALLLIIQVHIVLMVKPFTLRGFDMLSTIY